MLENRRELAPEGPAIGAENFRGSRLSVRVRTLREMALTLLHEIEGLGEKSCFDARDNINFADEVRRFEADLITWALKRTGGHQRRAARLLGIKVTTLNAKIKRYGIPTVMMASMPSRVVDLNSDARR